MHTVSRPINKTTAGSNNSKNERDNQFEMETAEGAFLYEYGQGGNVYDTIQEEKESAMLRARRKAFQVEEPACGKASKWERVGHVPRTEGRQI